MGWVWFIAAVVGAVLFYWLRREQRALYGVSEIAIGIAILAAKFLSTPPNLLAVGGESPWGLWWYHVLTSLIALFTGMYAIVRGLDNVVGEKRYRHL
jgi:hypothetical protein